MKRLGVLLLAAWLLALPATAQQTVHKDEVVYARLSLAGDVQSVYIVNAFEADAETQVRDRGHYTRVTNLTDEQTLSAADGALSFHMRPGRFSYQGDAESLKLPWEVALQYTLDEKPLAPGALSGATGLLGIRLRIQVRGELAAYAQGMTLQVTLSLPAARARNIVAPKATMAWAGSQVTLTYAVLPGMAAEYEVQAQVADFAMAPVQIAGVRMAVDSDMYKQMAQQSLQDSPLAGAVGNLMDNMLAGMVGAESQSFADTENGKVRTLQFVLLTDEVPEKPQEKGTPVEAASADEAAGGFFSRLLKLFGL